MSNLKKAISIVLAVLMVASVSPLSMAYVTFPNGDPYVAGTDYVYSDSSVVTNPTPITVDTYGTTETIRIANKDRPILDYKEESGVRTSYVVRANDAGIAETSGSFANFAYGYLSGVAQSLPVNPVIKLRINGISSTDPISGLAISCDGLTGSVGTPTSTTGSNYVEYTWTVPTTMYTTFNSSGTGEGDVDWIINFTYAKRQYVAHAYSAKKYVVRPNGMARVGKWEPATHNNKSFAHITQLLCAQSIPGFASTSGGDHSYFDYTVNNLSGNALSGGGYDDLGNGTVIIDDWTNGGTAWFKSAYKKDDWDTWKTINPANAEAKYRPKSLNGDAPRTQIYIDTPYDHLGVGTANGKTNGLNLRLVWKTTDKGGNDPQRGTFMEAIAVRASASLGSNLGSSTASCGSASAGTMSVNLSHVYHDGSGWNNLSSMSTQGRKSDGTGGWVNADGDTLGPNYVLHSFSGTGALTSGTTWSIDYLIKSTLNNSATDSDWVKSTNTLQVTFITYNTTTLRTVLTAIDNGTGFTYNNTTYQSKGKFPQSWMYTSESWTAFETAYKNARMMIAKFNVTQNDINTALGNLVSAYNGLTGYVPTGTITVRHCLVNTTTELVPAQTFTRATTWPNQSNSSYSAINNGASFSISGLVNSSNQCTLRGYKFAGPSNIRGSATFTTSGTVLTDEYDANLGSEIVFYYEPATVKLKVATGIYDVGHEGATGQQFVYNADVRTGDDLNAAATVNDFAEIKSYIESHYTHPAYTVYGGMYDNSSYSGQNIDGINLAGGLTSWKMPPQDTNAYIKWNAKPVKLRINTTYGTVYTDLAAAQTPAILDSQTYEMGTVTFDLTAFNHPTSDGYDFVNYYKEAAYTTVAGNTITASYDNSEEYRIVVDGTSDYNYVDIYAKYVNLSSKIVFDPQGGTIADNTAVGNFTVVGNELSYAGATLPVSVGYPIPVRPGYVFKGWTLQDGTPISGWTTYDATNGYSPVANGTHSMTGTTGIIAYAQWTPGQIMMTFQLNFDPSTESYTMNSKNMEGEDFYYRTTVLADQDVDRTLFPSDPRRYGYVFNYWSYEGRRFTQAKYPTSDFTLTASWKAATDTAFGELISYVNVGGEDQIADIQHKNSNKLNPIARKGDTVKVRFEVGGLFYAGSSSWIFAYDADVFEQVTGVTARANSNNAYINGIKAQIYEVNGAAAFNAYDDDMDKVGGKVVDPRDGSQINNPGYIQVTLDPDVTSMTNGYKTVSFDDVETYMIELILKIRTDTTKTSGSIWMPTELARSADNIMGDTYIAYSASEQALTNVETDVIKFDAEPVSTVKLVPEERPDTAITLALPTNGGVTLGEFVDRSADPVKRSTGNKTFYGPEGTEILSTFTTDDTNYYETYTGNGTPWNVVGFPEPERVGYHITGWNKTSGSGTAGTWDSYNFASADQDGNTYTASWEADSHTIYFYNDPECTNLRGEVAAVYDQIGIVPVTYQSGAITEFIGWIHQGDPCDAAHVLPSDYFDSYPVTKDDSFYAYTKNARKTVSITGYNDTTNANIGTVNLTEAVQDALGIELRVGDTLSIVNTIPATPVSGYYYITKETADTLLRGEYTYESGGNTVTVSSTMGSTAKNFYAIKDITSPINLAIVSGDNEVRVAYRPLNFTVYFKSAPTSGNFVPVVDGANGQPGYNGGFGETLVTDPDTGILTWSITGPYNTTYDFDIASAGLVAPFGWKFQNYTPGTNRGTFRGTGTNTSMTYTAQWIPASVTVHWLGEDFADVKTATCNYNANYNVYSNAPSMTKDGYQFMGWKHAIVSGGTYTPAGDLITSSANSIYNCSTSPEGTTYVVGTGVGTVASESDYIGLGADATYDIYYLPVFQINQYNIIYNTIYTDGEYNPDPFGIGYDFGSTVTEFATVSDVPGYTFDGWYDESVYADRTNVITSKTIGAQNINVYGYFTPNNYTVNFDPNGGTGGVQGVTVAYNAQITAPATAPTRTGYELLGWAETSNATEALATLPDLTETAATIGGVAKTLYAVWGINQYTISYDANGGTLTDEATATFDYNVTITNPTAPTRTGYDFAGWAYSNADTHEAYTGSTMPAFNLDAVAQWDIKSYEVTFDTDGGSANTTSSFDYGATIVPPADPTKTGYTFAGWSGIPADGKMPAENITVIATWTANVYTINYNTDGTAVAADVLTYGTDSVPAKSGKVTTKDGYDFDDWYLESALTTAYTSDWATVIANAQPKAGGNANEYEMTVYAGWDINEYTITFDSQGGSAVPSITQNYNTDITPPADPTREGYTFTGWSPAIPAKMPARDTTVVAGWQLEGYTIHFNSMGGSAVADISRAYGLAISAPANPTKTGHEFQGWYTDTDCTPGNEFTFPETMPDLGANGAEITLYANWSTNEYTITFDSKGGSAVAPITQDYNTAVTAPAAPTKTGYTFAGWYTDAEYTGNEYTFSTMPAQSFTLYAKWRVNQYTITFDSKGGSAVTAITQDYGTAVSAPTAPTKTGYDFIGWYTDSDCTDGHEYTFSTMPAENITLYAKWQIKQYTISFDSKGGSAVPAITQNYNTAVTAPADPTRTGYTFDKSNGTSGWYTDSNCTAGNEYTFSTMPAQNITLYAKWTVAEYTITILDGIDNTIIIDTITQDYDTVVTPTEPTRTGYTFGGYYEEAALQNQYTFSRMPAENINVYVKWIAIEIRVDFLEPDASYNPADSAHNTLTFNDKAVFNNISSYYVDFNETLTQVPSGNPEPAYYTFIGWSETEGGAVIENISAWVINEANFSLVQTVGGEKVVYLYPVFEREDVTLEVEVVEDGPVIVTADGGDINGYIYNAGTKLTKSALAGELRVIGNGTLIITASKGKYCGTGTKIELKDNVTNQIVEVYYVVVCGDLNGDANCNSVDLSIAEARVTNGETNNKVSAEINHCYDLAGDVNGDGLFNTDDTAAIEAYLFHDVSYDFDTNIGKYVVVPKNA